MTFSSEIIWLSIESGEKEQLISQQKSNRSVSSRTNQSLLGQKKRIDEGIEVQVGVEFSKQSMGSIDLFNMEQVLFDTSLSISM